MKRSALPLALALGAALVATDAQAQAWTSAYTSTTATGDCAGLPAALSSADFVIEPIISRTIFSDTAIRPARITKLAFWLNPTTQKADIFVGERGGVAANGGFSAARVSYYDASATPPTLKVIGSFTQAYTGFSESGVFGLAVNPMTFNQDNFLYVMYATGSATTPSATNGWRVSRFKLAPVTRMMDMNSEKVLLHIPAGTAGRWHTGTSLRFDNFGNLYIGAADNEATANGPANTADLRGGILRIKPDSTVARGYTIPAGNFGSYWAQKWQDSGLVARATAYRDTAIVKPEIYVKGSRNPYGFGVDPNRLGWLNWAECGPDAQRGEEHNFTTKPAFSGWPFWAANGVRQAAYASSYDEAGEPKTTTEWTAFNPTTMSTQMPINNWSGNTGYDTLPPMHVPWATQTSGCSIGGPILRYDGRITNPDKLPPHLDNVAISWNGANWYGIKLDTATGTPISTATTIFTMSKSTTTPSLSNMSEIAQGPDGVLYGVDQSETCCGTRSLNNREGVAKLRYVGTCKDPGLFPTLSATAIAQNNTKNFARSADWLRVGSSTFSLTAPGPHEASIVDVGGRVLKTFTGEGHKTYSIPSLGQGVHVLRVKTSQGVVSSVLASQL